MKRIALLIISLFILLATNQTVFGQCTPDPQYTSPGIYPATVPDGCVNSPYSETITVIIPADTTVNIPPTLTVPIQSVELVNVLGLPPGVTYQCSAPNCLFPGNSTNCVQVSGTPTTAGVYTIDLVTTSCALVFGSPFCQTDTTFGFYTITITPPPSITISGATTICQGSSTVLDAGSGYSSYMWSDGSTTQTATLPAGNHSVTVMDGSCTASQSVTVTQGTPVSASVNVDSDENCGQADGAATVTINNPTGNETIAWSNGATSPTASGLTQGIYTVTVSSASCDTTLSVTIGNIGGPSVVIDNSQDVSCSGGNDGSIDVSISGGSSPYTIAWSNGATTPNLSNLSAGTYILTVTDQTSCSGTVSVTITEPTPIAIAQIPVNPSCNGASDGEMQLMVNGGVPPYSFLWSDGSTNQNLTGVPAGNYDVTVTDANGCTETLTNLPITDPPVIMVNIDNATDVSCNGAEDGSIQISVSGGTGGYTYSWSNGETSGGLSNVGPGDYTVTVTDMNNCSSATTTTISEPTALSGTMSSTNTLTNTGSAEIVVTGGTPPYTYAWSNGETTDAISQLEPGIYTVVVTDANGCEYTDSTEVSLIISIEKDLAAGLSSFQLYPNPNEGQFSVDIELMNRDNLALQIFDMSGKQIYAKNLEAGFVFKQSINLNAQPAGIYLLQVTTSQGVTTKRFAIE